MRRCTRAWPRCMRNRASRRSRPSMSFITSGLASGEPRGRSASAEFRADLVDAVFDWPARDDADLRDQPLVAHADLDNVIRLLGQWFGGVERHARARKVD